MEKSKARHEAEIPCRITLSKNEIVKKIIIWDIIVPVELLGQCSQVLPLWICHPVTKMAFADINQAVSIKFGSV